MYYGLEFLTGYAQYVKRIQVHINDCLRSLFRTPPRLANNILLAECGVAPVHITGGYLRQRCFSRMINRRYCDDHPWFRAVRNDWGNERMQPFPQYSDAVLGRHFGFRICASKDAAAAWHRDWLEDWAGDPFFFFFLFFFF